MIPKAAIVLPTYNEVKNIESVIHAIFAQQSKIPAWELHVVVVDSASPDNTGAVVERLIHEYPRLHLIKSKKEGLGKAYLTGFEIAIQKLSPEVLFEMDADHSHDPDKIPEFLSEIDKGADLVIGTRYSKGGSIPRNWGLDRKIYSIGANIVIRLGFMRIKNTEWTNGYRAIKTSLVEKLMPYMSSYTGYVFQVASLDKAINLGAKIAEIPIHFTDRIHGQSKINTPQYILQTFAYVFTHSSFIRFVIVGLIGALVDFGTASTLKRVGATLLVANAVSTELAVVCNFLLNNYWSFSHSRITKLSKLIPNFIKFNLVSLGNIVIQLVGISIGVLIGGERYWIIYKLLTIVCVVIPYSYILYNKVIWKKK
ncbi:MAG: glycosyltransferase [Candidatus Roizmanbacteria bacterium]